MARALYEITVEITDAQGRLRRSFYFSNPDDRMAFWAELQLADRSAKLISRGVEHLTSAREAMDTIKKGQRSLLDAF